MLRALITLTLVTLGGMTASAAPRCLDLTKAQADKAVTVMKIAVSKGSSLLLKARGESGLVKPMGIWSEKKKHKRGRTTYRVRIDGREMDISLIYVARSENDGRAYNVGWMAGCRPAPNKPNAVRNW